MKKEGKLAVYLLLHIFPFDILPNFLPLPLSRQSEEKNVSIKGVKK